MITAIARSHDFASAAKYETRGRPVSRIRS